MGYDITVIDRKTKKPLFANERHNIGGSMYMVGGNDELWLAITYNYNAHFKKVLGEGGLQLLDGMEVKPTISILEKVISRMEGEPSANYWEATEGNAKKALENLLKLLYLAPEDGVIDIS